MKIKTAVVYFIITSEFLRLLKDQEVVNVITFSKGFQILYWFTIWILLYEKNLKIFQKVEVHQDVSQHRLFSYNSKNQISWTHIWNVYLVFFRYCWLYQLKWCIYNCRMKNRRYVLKIEQRRQRQCWIRWYLLSYNFDCTY